MKIEFPVIITTRNSFYPLTSETELYSGNSVQFRKSSFKNLKVIDLNGNVYYSKHVKPKNRNLVKSISRRLFNYKFEIEIEFNPKIETMTLDDLKLEMIKEYKKDRFFWESGGDFDGLIQNVKSGISIKSIIEEFSANYYRKY